MLSVLGYRKHDISWKVGFTKLNCLEYLKKKKKDVRAHRNVGHGESFLFQLLLVEITLLAKD